MVTDAPRACSPAVAPSCPLSPPRARDGVAFDRVPTCPYRAKNRLPDCQDATVGSLDGDTGPDRWTRDQSRAIGHG